jgi:site-specific recombinase XerD
MAELSLIHFPRQSKSLPVKSTAIRESKRLPALVLLDEFLDYGKMERRYSDMTIRRYRVVIGDFLNFIGNLDISLVRPRDIRAYFDWLLERGASDQTLRQVLCSLRSFYRYLEICDLVSVSPARAVQTRKFTRRLPKPLSEEDVNKLIGAATSLRDRALIEFTYSAGCRIAEVAGARVESVSWSNRTVTILGKGDKERLVPLGSRAIEVLQNYLAGRTEGWLFQAEAHPDQRGRVMRTTNGKWRGIWRENYAFDSKGRLTWTDASKLLGNISDMTRAEAKECVANIVSQLPPRPRPVKEQPLDTRNIRDIVVKTALRAGLGHVNPHRLRHTFATHLHAHGADILTISRLLGHVNLSTTQIYTHVSQKTVREALEKFHPHWSRE